MKRALSLTAAALLVLVNAWVLIGVARNRVGDPDATLVLSERELLVRRATARENSGVELVLEVNYWRPGQPIHARYEWAAWLPPERLAELGFNPTPPTSFEEAQRMARRQPARRGWAVVQLGGSTWDQWAAALDAEMARPDRNFAGKELDEWRTEQRLERERELRTGTRLFVVDAGPDADALRAAHPDRAAFVILPAQVHLAVSVDEKTATGEPQRSRLVGRVSLLTSQLQVPRRLQALLPPEPPSFQAARDDERSRPRFEAVIRAGARRELWIESIRPWRPPTAAQ